MKRMGLCCVMVWALVAVTASAAAKDDPREAFHAFNDFIGDWNGNGEPVKPRPASSELWRESITWSWRFKGDDAWLVMEVANGRHFKSGELRFLPKKKKYEFTAVDLKGNKLVFEGDIKNNYLTLERTDPATKDTHRLIMNSAAEGVRFIYRSERTPEGTEIVRKEYQVQATKKDQALGVKEKKNECVVSGGLGTSTVSYKGETFWVCCSGCRDEFLANPEKYIKEFKAKKKK